MFSLRALLDTARTLDQLLQLEKKLRAVIDSQAHEIQDLKDRVTRLEAREEVLIAEAKGAAAAVGSAAAAQHVSDVSRRLGILEERTRPGQARLLSPDGGSGP